MEDMKDAVLDALYKMLAEAIVNGNADAEAKIQAIINNVIKL
jgi:hypothetical protein